MKTENEKEERGDDWRVEREIAIKSWHLPF